MIRCWILDFRMRVSYVVWTLVMGAITMSSCCSVQHCFDRCARGAAYKRQLAKARQGGTRADVRAAFPATRRWAGPMFFSSSPPTGPEYYRLDSDHALVVSF